MNHKDALPGSGMSQDQPFSSGHPIFLHLITPASLDVVVAHDEMESVLLVKSVQQVKDAPMGIPNIAEPPVLPQFVAISNFNISEIFPEVVSQCVKEHSFIPGKGIGPTVVPPVAVA